MGNRAMSSVVATPHPAPARPARGEGTAVRCRSEIHMKREIAYWLLTSCEAAQ